MSTLSNELLGSVSLPLGQKGVGVRNSGYRESRRLPFFFSLSLSFSPRSNIGNARLGGLEESLGLTPQEYQWALSVFYFGYVIFDLPSNIVMRRWRPSIWLGTLML